MFIILTSYYKRINILISKNEIEKLFHRSQIIMMKFVKSVLAYSINFFSFLSNRVDTKALELKEKTDQEINIAVLRKDYEEQVNIALDDQYKKFTNLTVECKTLENQIKNDDSRLKLIATEIIKAENETKTVNREEIDPMELMALDYGLKNMRLEAKTLLSDIQFNNRFLGEQKQTMIKMAEQYHENRYRAKQALRELLSLEQRNALVESRTAIEQLELGVSNYKISDIIRIVEGKEAAVEAKSFADSVLLREGTRTALDHRLENAQSEQLDVDLNNYLISVQETTQIKTKEKARLVQ